MSIINNNLLLAAEEGGYRIERSLRFRSDAGANLYKNITTTATDRRKFTYSTWLKLGNLGTGVQVVANQGGVDWIYFINNKLYFEFSSAAGGGLLVTTQVFRDPSAWYHIVCVFDSTNATPSERMKIYVNGIQLTSFTSNTAPTQNFLSTFMTTGDNYIGAFNGVFYLFDGYQTEINHIDGQALTPSSFGEFNALTGVWQPKAYEGTYGTNGFYLNFSDNASTSALGTDYSGNGNTWTTNNISLTAGVTYDSMIDVPTPYDDGGNGRGNYCVLNPISNGLGSAPSNGNLRQSGISAVTSRINSTVGVSSGKWYFETTLTTAANFTTVGIGQNNITSQYPGKDSLSYAQDLENAKSINNDAQPSYGTALGSGDVFMCAFDLDNNKLFFGRNGTWFGSSDPAAGTNPVYTLTAGTYNAIARPNPSGFGSGGVLDFNFGQRPFAYTPPTGFKALNTQNLPEPVIAKGNEYFDATLYTGNNTGQTVTNSGGMQPDLLWIKVRSNTYDHVLADAVRGVSPFLASNTTTAEGTNSELTSFNSNGFTLGATGSMARNVSGQSYVAWQWRASNAAAVTNTAGSITSTVSANPTAGFSIVTYTGNGSTGATFGHGLSVSPSMVIVKRRNTTGNWITYHASTGLNQYLYLNSTAASATATPTWGVSSTTVTLQQSFIDYNNNGSTYVAYCFSEVAGYSRFGSYTGNGSANGPFVFCGFRPRFVMLKNSSNAPNVWVIHDTARDVSNVVGAQIYPNLSDAEFFGASLDVLSNGFKIRSTSGGLNGNGQTYIFMAFAEHPFKLSLAR